MWSVGFERDRLRVIIFEFLLSQIWSGEEDSFIWASRASSSAQALGMHRSTAESKMPIRQQHLWRRVWWCIYIRDRHSAAATGRPTRIHGIFNNVESPQQSDFEGDCDWELFCESVKLAHIGECQFFWPRALSRQLKRDLAWRWRRAVGDVAGSRSFAANRTTNDIQAECSENLAAWFDQLPRRLANTNNGEIFTTFLHISYQYVP